MDCCVFVVVSAFDVDVDLVLTVVSVCVCICCGLCVNYCGWIQDVLCCFILIVQTLCLAFAVALVSCCVDNIFFGSDSGFGSRF